MIFSLLVGAAGGTAIKKMKPNLYPLLCWVVGAYLGYYYFMLRYHTETEYFLSWACVGVVAAYAVMAGYSVFVGPLMGKYPTITNFYVRRGIVQRSGTVTEHGSTSTARQGVFGNTVVDTQHYSVNHDHFIVREKDGTDFVVSGTFMRNQAKDGDEIIVGGTPGNRHSVLINATQQSRYESQIATPVGAVLAAIVFAIPALGEFVLAVIFAASILLSKVMRFKGAISELPTHNERTQLSFAIAYRALAVASAGALLQTHNFQMAAIVYFGINIVVGGTHFYLWQKDLTRFHEFLREKMRASA